MSTQKNLRSIIDEIAAEGVVINMRLLENNHGWNYFLIQIRGNICGENIQKIISRLNENKYDFKFSAGDHVLFIETVPWEPEQVVA